MKKFSIVVLAACSILSIPALQAAQEQPQAFEDKPALTRAERAALAGARVTGAAGAGVAGGLIGVKGGREILRRSMTEEEKSSPLYEEELERSAAVAHGLAGVGVGGYAGYKGAGSAVIYALAKLHGVSYRVELVSQYYNINVSQYRQILTMASLQNPDALIEAIDEVYPTRFGSDWNKRLEQLFKRYGNRAETLVKHGTFTRKKNVRDFVRMIELGAAMANLYYGTKPNPKNTVDSATKFYKELGLLK